MSDCPYGLAMEWHRIYIGLTMFVKSSSVETLRSVPFSKLVPRLDTSWSPVLIGKLTEDWRCVGVRSLMFAGLAMDRSRMGCRCLIGILNDGILRLEVGFV